MQFNLAEALVEFQSSEKDSYRVENSSEKLNVLTDYLAVSPESLAQSEVFESAQDLANSYPQIPTKEQDQLIYVISSSLTQASKNASQIVDDGDIESLPAMKKMMELYGYLIHCFLVYLGQEDHSGAVTVIGIRKASKKASEAYKRNCLLLETLMESITSLFRVKLGRFFQTTPEKDAFISLFTRPVYSLMEFEHRMKAIGVKMYMFKVICMAVKLHGHAPAAETAIMQNLTYFFHLTAYMAELLQVLYESYDHTQLCENILRDVATKEFNPNDTNGPKTVSQFIIKISELMPKVVMRQMSLVAQLLDNSSFTLRTAVVEACGNIVAGFFESEQEVESHKEELEQFLDLLQERILDQNPFVRTKAIQALCKLCDLKAKLVLRRQAFADLAVNCLEDRSSLVRKNAVKLVCKLLLTHPFSLVHGSQLKLSEWEKRLGSCKAALHQLDPKEGEWDEQQERERERMEDDEEEEEEEGRTRRNVNMEAIYKLQFQVKYYEDCVQFIKTIHKGTEYAAKLIYSKSKSEVLESMDFFVLANAFDIETAGVGISKMLHLVWMNGSNDDGTAIASKLIECYTDLFLSAPDGTSASMRSAHIAGNLISLTYNATVADLASLEKLLCLMYQRGYFNDEVVRILWQHYNSSKEDNAHQKTGSIIVLGMLALENHQVALRGVDLLLTVGLGDRMTEDLVLAKYTCVALQRIVPKKDESVRSYEIERANEAIEKLFHVTILYTQNSEWYSVAEQSLNAIYSIAQNPEDICGEIIKQKIATVFEPRVGGQVQSIALSQLLFIVGHVAIKTIVHLKECEDKFKKRKFLAEQQKNAGANKNRKQTEKEAQEAAKELEMIGGTAEDDFTDAVLIVKEKELLHGDNSLLAKFGPLVREVCLNNNVYNDTMLQRAAVLCMEKLMCVSPKYCEDNLPLLITIMEKSEDAVIRSNAVLGLGDMAVSFNNLVDENTDFLYKRLTDDSLMVQRTCLMTVTFLILAGQVKVKGQLAQMAKCLENPDQSISDMCKLFFTELATKDNAIYNGFIDIFSGLSSDSDLSKESFKYIVKFLLGFIEKERHQKQLSDKLLARLGRCESVEEWQDVAFVLSTLPTKNDHINEVLQQGYKNVETRS